ncbi:flagellar biosynthesis anti-sigma factor FlgM [Endozoicomonas sp. SCSIO W0465]|uniref:flagellar biosynthesis anti-sigma factor FlgM n=1 Tax=Endozoicomonas sp. SCSIO W0465 TaxID=2918516 RepID=UPI0020761E1A|nr:flagellar biosynthesis anti-sigma factor FlgM [Endozoicomonas sp. SCSIO W0465]USE37628.1 flagellar biosynthesis anti-sigma factor FlgM [Endozoicomonas sp. SCSIO W0465]
MSSIKGPGGKKAGAVNSSKVRVEKSAAVDRSPRVAEDRLNVSASAQQIDELFQQLADLDDVNAARIRSVRESIKKGNFPIDYQRLADKILELSDELNSENDD